MEDRMRAPSFASTLFPFPRSVFTVFLFPLTFLSFFLSHPLHRRPSSLLLPLTLFPLCLTAVRLLWEVIRKNSTERHTQQLLKTRLSIVSTLSLHYNSKRLAVREWWGRVRRHYQDIFREWCRGGNAALVIPHFYAPRYLMQGSNYLYQGLCQLEAKGLVWSCLV